MMDTITKTPDVLPRGASFSVTRDVYVQGFNTWFLTDEERRLIHRYYPGARLMFIAVCIDSDGPPHIAGADRVPRVGDVVFDMEYNLLEIIQLIPQ